MIVRARVRTPDEIDPKQLCCDHARECLEENGGTIIEIDPIGTCPDIYCPCGHDWPTDTTVRITKIVEAPPGPKKWPFEVGMILSTVCIDIDEGGL